MKMLDVSIPVTMTERQMEITVRRGDTLWALAKQHLGNALRWRELWEANKDAIEREQHRVMRRDLRGPNWIVPGTKIVVEQKATQKP